MSKRRRVRYSMAPEEVTAWFAQYAYAFVPDERTSDNEIAFCAADGARIMCRVSYTEGCPTCGGAYVKEWNEWRNGRLVNQNHKEAP